MISGFLTFIGSLVVLYLVVGMLVIIFDPAESKVEMAIDESKVTENRPWVSKLLCICLWPVLLFLMKDDDEGDL